MSELSDLTDNRTAPHAPRQIRLVHGMADDEHVFTSPDLAGFRIASPDLEAAFDAIEGSLGYLVGEAFGARQPYVLNLTYRDYVEQRYARHRQLGEAVELFAVRVSHACIHDPNADFVPEARRRRDARRQLVAK